MTTFLSDAIKKGLENERFRGPGGCQGLKASLGLVARYTYLIFLFFSLDDNPWSNHHHQA